MPKPLWNHETLQQSLSSKLVKPQLNRNLIICNKLSVITIGRINEDKCYILLEPLKDQQTSRYDPEKQSISCQIKRLLEDWILKNYNIDFQVNSRWTKKYPITPLCWLRFLEQHYLKVKTFFLSSFLSAFKSISVCKYPMSANKSEIYILLPKLRPFIWNILLRNYVKIYRDRRSKHTNSAKATVRFR